MSSTGSIERRIMDLSAETRQQRQEIKELRERLRRLEDRQNPLTYTKPPYYHGDRDR